MSKKNKLPVRFTGQHFTVDKLLIADLIKYANLTKNDTVLDIGAGKGFLTLPLTAVCKTVIAIENDNALLEILRNKFAKNPKFTIVPADFRKYTIPKKPFKVVSNIPYRITAYILKYLLFHTMGYFEGGTLILQLQPAQKLTSQNVLSPYKIFYRSFFDLQLQYTISPDSFFPPPTVSSAFLQIKRKKTSIPVKTKERYISFLFYFLRNPELPVKTALKLLFRKSQIREMSEMYRLPLHQQITTLTPEQWLSCFLYLLENVPEKFHPKKPPEKLL